MSQYNALLAELNQLNEQIATARKAEADNALAQVRALVDDFGFTATDIFGARRGVKRSTATPLFRNPETGETWSGRGREPHWIKGKDREALRINA
jgi:DNA-binding protein H-NS